MTSAIVTTTINARPDSYKQYAAQGDLIVAADISTPHNLYDYCAEIGAVVLTPEEQEHANPHWSDIVGWRSIQRRNAAVMHAFARREEYDTIITVDDDNIPGDDFVEKHEAIIHGDVIAQREGFPAAGSNWLNFGELTEPPTWQRGTPYGPRTELRTRPWQGTLKVGVSQSQVLGAPDCDAVTRIAYDPIVTGVKHGVILHPAPNCRFAFNSQATAYDPELAPLIGVLPFVGRYDDIIASFITGGILYRLGMAVHVGEPLVTQERNPHDYTKDLQGEIWGMQRTERIVDRIYDAMARPARGSISKQALSFYRDITYELSNILPKETVEFMRGWATTWEENL